MTDLSLCTFRGLFPLAALGLAAILWAGSAARADGTASASPAKAAQTKAGTPPGGEARRHLPRAVIDSQAAAPVTIYDHPALTALGWTPDGTMGILPGTDANHYTSLSATAGKPFKAIGSLDAPARAGHTSAPMAALKDTWNYIAGGPLYKDPRTGTWVMFYHAERWPGGVGTSFWSSVGVAKSTDAGASWTDCGAIISPNTPYDAAVTTYAIDVYSGAFALVGGYVYVYFQDRLTDGTVNHLCVARCLLTSFMSSVTAGAAPVFSKYDNGAWTQPGLGGASTALETGDPVNRWFDVLRHAPSGQLVMVLTNAASGSTLSNTLYAITSPDGLSWSKRTVVVTGKDELFYPTLYGPGAAARAAGHYAYLYYTQSATGEFGRGNDDALMRLQLALPSPVTRSPTRHLPGTKRTRW